MSGTRYANGIPMTPMNMTSIAGYIPQFDLFIGTLTVREHLTFLVCLITSFPFRTIFFVFSNLFQATLRVGNRMSKEERQEKVEEVMKEVYI